MKKVQCTFDSEAENKENLDRFFDFHFMRRPSHFSILHFSIFILFCGALCAQPPRVRQLYGEAFALQADYKPQQAIARLQQLVAIDSTFHPAYNLMGYIYEDAYADFDSAMMCYRRAAHLNPDYAKVYLNIGHLHYRQMHYDSAMLYIERSLALDSNYADAYFDLGWVYNSKGNLARSLQLFRQAAQLGSEAAKKWLSQYGYHLSPQGEGDTLPAAKGQPYRREKPVATDVSY